MYNLEVYNLEENMNMKILSYAEKAKYDTRIIKKLLNPHSHVSVTGTEYFVPVAGARFEYLKDPVAWINSYSGHVTEFSEDSHYLEYVVGLLEAIVNDTPYRGQNIYCPILLLKKMVTRKVLMQCRDPMRTALRLQYHLLQYAQIENDNNSIYDRSIEELELIPKTFALSLMEACFTPTEVIKLMKLDDDTMWMDVLQSKNVELVASKMYQKVVWKKFWGSGALENTKARSGKYTQTLYVAKRVAVFLFWNIFYIPASICSREEGKKRKRQAAFFTPFSTYLADLINYSMLITLLLVVILVSVPDPEVPQIYLKKLSEGKISIENNTNFKVGSNGTILMRLPDPKIPFLEWLLWTCIFARILTEFYQLYSKKEATVLAKIRGYFSSFHNIADIFLVTLLLTGMVSKLYTSIKSWSSGVYVVVIHNHETDDEVDLVPHELIFTIYFYCIGAVAALVHLLQIYTIHVPGLGPLILSAKRTFTEVSGLVFIYLFVIVGFLIPIVGMMTCYRVVHGIDGVEDDDDFHYFASFSKALVTLIWTMFGGLDVEHRSNLHKSRDSVTTVFVSMLLVLYAIILGLLCMNLVIAIIVDVYGRVTSAKHAEWRFSQFESIIEYGGGSNDDYGMPFLFPMCIPYIFYSVFAKPTVVKTPQSKHCLELGKDSDFARFLCQFRLSDEDD